MRMRRDRLPALRSRQSLNALAVAILLSAVAACVPEAQTPPERPPTPVQPNEMRFGLTFEERMAIPPELSRLRAEASRRADEVYDPFRSREEAIKNEEFKVELYEDAKDAYLEEKGLAQEELDLIVEEYQTSLGANLR